ncbi:MAG: hypothetical protein AAFN07_07940 [Pseudomonadota bacterium]
MKRMIAGIIATAIVGSIGAILYINYKTTQAVDQFVLSISPFVQVEYDKVSSSVTGEVAVKGVTVTMPGFADPMEFDAVGLKLPTFLDLLSLHDLGPLEIARGEFPEKIAVFVDGLHLDTGDDYMMAMFRSMEAQAVEENGGTIPTRSEDPLGHCISKYGVSSRDLLELGLDRMRMSLRYQVEQLDGEIAADLNFEIQDALEIDTQFTIQGRLADFATGRADRARLIRFEVEGETQGITERTWDRCETMGVERAIAKEAYITSFLAGLAEGGFVADERLIEPFRVGVVAEHRHFRVIGDPPQPVDLQQVKLYSATDMPALLGVDYQTW